MGDEKADLAIQMSIMLSYMQFATSTANENDAEQNKSRFDEAVNTFRRTLNGLGYIVVKKDD